ncbi:MAG: hypothetical protein NVS4B11_19820 [Ktedonobacteraceae bacterium]
MHSVSNGLLKPLAWIAAGMVLVVVFHLGGSFAHLVGQFSPLIGAFIGGGLTLFCASVPTRHSENTEHWTGFEQVSWLLIGCAIILWGLGESFWRYYIAIGQTPFPSIADAGYSLFPLLAFLGLLLQPSSANRSRRFVLVMDSLISMGSIFAIAWYLLLGALAQAPGEANLAKFLGIYYPTADMALLSCVVFLLLRGQGRVYQANARRISLLVIGLGFCFFIASDFFFNIQNNAGTYVEATWVDLGWPLGMMTIGAAAYLRRFLPATSEAVIQQRMEQNAEEMAFRPQQLVPYALLGLLFVVLTLDVLASDAGQRAIRPVLLFSTLTVVGLVVARQIFTLWDNMRLSQWQAEALEELGRANMRAEKQARQITDHNIELEQGIEHLKAVQASLANGNLRARAHLTHGALLPLAGSLNLMAERLTRLGQGNMYAQRLLKALSDLSIAFEHAAPGVPLAIPASCSELTEMNRLLVALRVKHVPPAQPAQQQLTPLPETPPAAYPVTQAMTTPIRLPVTQPLIPANRTTKPQPHQTDTQRLGVRPRNTILGLRPSPHNGKIQ